MFCLLYLNLSQLGFYFISCTGKYWLRVLSRNILHLMCKAILRACYVSKMIQPTSKHLKVKPKLYGTEESHNLSAPQF
jgi:hypothetical protein